MEPINCKEVLNRARRGELAPDAPEWALQYFGEMLAEIAIREGFIPPDFNGWHWLTNSLGTTLAYYGLTYKQLVTDFDGLYWGDIYASTLAHKVVERQNFSTDFRDWHFSDKWDWTVAHTAAQWKQLLPPHFQGWHWVDHRGKMVYNLVNQYQNISENSNLYNHLSLK